MSEQVHSIVFSDTGVGNALKAELDSVANDDATTFAYGSSCYFRVYTHPATLPVTVTPSAGEVYGAGEGSYQVTETVAFNNSNQASATYPVQDIVSTAWYGSDLGGVVVKDSAVIQAARSGVGVLKIIYNTRFKRYRVRLETQSESEFPVLLFIQGGGSSIDDSAKPTTSLTVTFYATSTTTTDYRFTVKNHCTDAVIPGVDVYVDEVKIGTTDSNGRVTMSNAIVGEDYTAYVNENGYRVFEATFTVPTPSTDDSEACS